jgi:hypothetical protein
MQDFQETLEQVLQLSITERIALMQALAASFAPETDAADDEPPLTEEEIAALMTVNPLPPSEIIKRGLTGPWAHLNIADGAEWVNARKAERRCRLENKFPD